jgi:threonine/homoserine/homoserine lactone efflux protein
VLPFEVVLAFAAASVALLVIPGPAVLYVINRSVAEGRRVGLAAVVGLACGTLVHVLAATAGLSAVLATSATAFSTIKWLGVLYLVGVGIRTLMQPVTPGSAPSGNTRRRVLVQGIVVNILNPKLALFFLSFLPQFLHPEDGAAAVQSLILGAIFVGLALTIDSLYAVTAGGLRVWLVRRPGGLVFLQRWFAGTMFVALGLVAATTTRTQAN